DSLLLTLVTEIDFVDPTEDAVELSLMLARAGVDETGQLPYDFRFFLWKRSALEITDPALGLHAQHRFRQVDASVQAIDSTCQDRMTQHLLVDVGHAPVGIREAPVIVPRR